MAESETLVKKGKIQDVQELHFDVSTGLKRVLGRELITNDEVAVFEMVKNSFDAGADTVHLYFDEDSVIVADNGNGMTYDDLNEKWLFVAYSAKRPENSDKDFRDIAAERHFAGSKGIGRFSSDRIGEELTLQTRPKNPKSRTVHHLFVDWDKFEKNDKQLFDKVPVEYSERQEFELPPLLKKFGATLSHGTVIRIGSLRRKWNRQGLIELKASLAKLINPFGADTDRFTIYINAPAQLADDKRAKAEATKAGEDLPSREIINGRVGNFIFSDLQGKTTFILVSIDDGYINTSLTDRGELIYKIREPNPYRHLDQSGFRCEIYYLNLSSKMTFARRVGLPSIQFGSVFLFRNGFRVYPIGEDGDDWFGFNRRKQQGYSRFLGTREIIGRVDVRGPDEDFQEASSRNQGLIDTAAVRQLQKAVMDHCLTQRAETAEAAVEHERRRSHFLESVVHLDTSTILNLHHQVTIYAVDVAQQIENLLSDTAGQKMVPSGMLVTVGDGRSGSRTRSARFFNPYRVRTSSLIVVFRRPSA